jgi:hypothetical protein
MLTLNPILGHAHLTDVSEPDPGMLLPVDVGLVVQHTHQIPADVIK